MRPYLELLGRAKSIIDNGFSQVGRGLSAKDDAHRALMLLASRGVAVSNALMLLSINNHSNEGSPLMRSLVQIAVEMRWIAEKDSATRARRFFDDHRDPEWDRLWSSAPLRERMQALGFQKSLQQRALLSCGDHLYANSQGLPWGHVFSDAARPGISGEDALRAAAAAMGHVVKALDMTWPGKFAGAEHLWEKADNKAG